MSIKPIETIYKGYRFRSRLEARWAVFFDELGVDYEYELEGYELEDGTRYLPDFYIPKEKLFVEIKGEYPNQKYKNILVNFTESIDKALLLICGTPGKQTMELYCYDSKGFSSGGVGWNDLPINFQYMIKSQRTYSTLNYEHSLDDFLQKTITDEPIYRYALDRARQARFEHGESP